MKLQKACFEFSTKNNGTVKATIVTSTEVSLLPAELLPCWSIQYYNPKAGADHIANVPEERTKQFANQTRAKQIVSLVLKSIK